MNLKFELKKEYERLKKEQYDKIFIYKSVIFYSDKKTIYVKNVENGIHACHEKDNFFIFYNSTPFLVNDINEKGFICYSGFFIEKEFKIIVYEHMNDTELDKIILPFMIYEFHENYEEYEEKMLKKYRYIKKHRSGVYISGTNYDVLPPLTKKLIACRYFNIQKDTISCS